MKNTIIKLLLTSIIVLSFQSANSQDTSKFVSVFKYLTDKKVSAIIKGLGGHSENCIEIELKNNTTDTLYIRIEPGRRLVSKDTTLQDILIVKGKELSLPPMAKTKFTIYGFCCEATMHSPYKDADFDIGYMAPESWINLVNLLNQYNFEPGTMQDAIWVLSNNHPLSSVSSNDENLNDVLRRNLAGLLGIEIPWFSVSYLKDTALVFTNKYDRVWGQIDYYVQHNSMITINIRAQNGKIMATLLNSTIQGPGPHTYFMNITVQDWPKGKYDIYIYEDMSYLIHKRSFEL
jgi:hypothetical protein